MMRHHLAWIVGRGTAARRGVDVELDAALAGTLEVVGVDLDLVRQRAPCRACDESERGSGERRAAAYWRTRSLRVVPLTRTTRPSFVRSTASPVMKVPLSMSTVWKPPAFMRKDSR